MGRTWKLLLPEPQHVLLDREFFGDLTNIPKRLGCLRHDQPPLKLQLTTYSAALRRNNPELMRSFMILLGRKTRTRRGVIGTSSPVFGLRPTRWPFWRMPKEPKEESLTASPAASVLEISFKMSSTSSWDSLRGRPTLCTTASARSARVSVLPPIGLSPSPTLYPRLMLAAGNLGVNINRLKLHI